MSDFFHRLAKNVYFNGSTFDIVFSNIFDSSGGVQASSSFAPDFTEWTQESDTVIIYVAASGSDSNPGTVSSAPKATLSSGYSALRTGSPDWLLFQRGDVWDVASIPLFDKTGPTSGSGYLRIGAYGDENLPRPELRVSGSIIVSPGFSSPNYVRRVGISDIYFNAYQRKLTASAMALNNFDAFQFVAVSWQGPDGFPFQDIIFENTRISGHHFGIVTAADIKNVKFRYNIIDNLRNSASDSGHCTGILCSASGLESKGNVFYNIMAPEMPGVWPAHAFSQFAHSCYFGAQASNVSSLGNISIRCPEGTMQRSGGPFIRNVSLSCNVIANNGQAWGVIPTEGGVELNVVENIAVNPITNPFYLGNAYSGIVIDNLLTVDADGTDVGAATFNPVAYNAGSPSGVNIGVHNTVFSGNYTIDAISWNVSDDQSFSGTTQYSNTSGIAPSTSSIADFLSNNSITGTTITDYATFLLERDRSNFTELRSSLPIINFYRSLYGMSQLS